MKTSDSMPTDVSQADDQKAINDIELLVEQLLQLARSVQAEQGTNPSEKT